MGGEEEKQGSRLPGAQNLKGEREPQFTKLAGRGESGGGVFRPNCSQTGGADVEAKGDPRWAAHKGLLCWEGGGVSVLPKDKMVQA